jgi:hypothetical protein
VSRSKLIVVSRKKSSVFRSSGSTTFCCPARALGFGRTVGSGLGCRGSTCGRARLDLFDDGLQFPHFSFEFVNTLPHSLRSLSPWIVRSRLCRLRMADCCAGPNCESTNPSCKHLNCFGCLPWYGLLIHIWLPNATQPGGAASLFRCADDSKFHKDRHGAAILSMAKIWRKSRD